MQGKVFSFVLGQGQQDQRPEAASEHAAEPSEADQASSAQEQEATSATFSGAADTIPQSQPTVVVLASTAEITRHQQRRC
jgi:hypothetical protein